MDADALPRINRVMLTGFLQQDPELRFTPGGVPVASFRVRLARVIPDGRGGMRETLSYVTVVAWQELAQRISREGRNGQGIYVEGFLHSRSFATTRGERRTVVEVYSEVLQPVPIHLPPDQAPAPEGVLDVPASSRRGGKESRWNRPPNQSRSAARPPPSREKPGAPEGDATTEGSVPGSGTAPAPGSHAEANQSDRKEMPTEDVSEPPRRKEIEEDPELF